MPSFKLKKFSHADWRLKEIAPDLLDKVLAAFPRHLSARGLGLAPATPLDYERLVSILANPDEDIPQAMVDALFFVHEMSDPEAMEGLLEMAGKRGVLLDLSEDPTPADVAIAVWLAAPRLLEEKHAEACVLLSDLLSTMPAPDKSPRTSPNAIPQH